MKLNNIVFIAAIISCVVAFTSCKKAADYRDVLYFTGTEQTPATKFTIDGPGSIGVSVTSSAKLNNDLKIHIQVQPGLLDAYNKETGKAYKFLPDGSYALSTDNIVIRSGSNVSESAAFSVTSVDNFEEGTIYCVPVTITSVEGNMEVLQSSKTMYLIINRTIITKAVNLANSNYFTVSSFASDPSLSNISELTMECRVYVNSFQSANPYISSVMGIEENFLLRFGDVSIEKNQLQLAGGLIDGKKYPVTSATKFSTGQWYHVAVVYNGSSVRLYVNGKLDASTEAPKGSINFTGTNGTYMGGFHIGFSETGRKLNGYVSEARVWTRALTANELQDNLCYVDPTSSGLLAYWRFNDTNASGNVTDLTGHGHTAVGASASPIWVEGVRCPE